MTVLLGLSGLLALASAASAQTSADVARRRLLCAQLGEDLSDPLGMAMFQRCLRDGPAAMPNGAPSSGRIPGLVEPVGPLVNPGGPLVTPEPATAPAKRGDGCRQGFVWREATPGDHVCVVPATREQARDDNAMARARLNPVDHSHGPDTCRAGFVWREATPGDHVCVTPDMRARARADNAAAGDRMAR